MSSNDILRVGCDKRDGRRVKNVGMVANMPRLRDTRKRLDVVESGDAQAPNSSYVVH